jgi:hypothetical protein
LSVVDNRKDFKLNNRLRLFLILLGALLVAATFAFPLWRPLLVREVADERFPGLSAEQQQGFLALPTEQQGAFYELMSTADATMVVGLAQAAVVPDTISPTEEQPTPQMTNPVEVASGVFTEIDPIHKGEGNVSLYQLPDNSRVLRFEDFRVTNGPDLRVILTRNPDPRTPEEVGTDYIELGSLKGNVGNQNYEVPANVDLNTYRGVVIYCFPFRVVFSTAELFR